MTEIRALLDRGSNCVLHVVREGDILQRTPSFLDRDACCCEDSGGSCTEGMARDILKKDFQIRSVL